MDFDKDGKLDLISGSYVTSPQYDAKRAPIHFFKGRGGLTFEPPISLKTVSGRPLNMARLSAASVSRLTRIRDEFPYQTKPCLVDINNDGNLDLIYGMKYGMLISFRGTAENALNRFEDNAELLVSATDKVLKVGRASTPQFIDWDQDGDFDIISGSKLGGVYFAENIGDADKAIWKDFVTWIDPPELLFSAFIGWNKTQFLADGINPWIETTVFAHDYNGDGKLDLVVGDSTRIESPLEGVSEEEFATKDSHYRKICLDRKLKQGHDFAKTYKKIDYTGFVWVYLQK